MNDYIKIFSEIPIVVRRLKSLLDNEQISSIVKSDKIVAYEISNNIDDLYVLNTDLEKATLIVEDFKKEITE